MIKNHYFFYWLYKKSRFRHIYNLGSGLFIWLFLLGTLPFGLYANNLGGPIELAFFLLPFGFMWIIISYTCDLVFSKAIAVDSKNVHHANFYLWIAKLFIQIHVYFLVRGWLCDWSCMNTSEYGELWIACLLLFLLTYIPFSLYGRYVYFHSLVGVSSGSEEEVTLYGEGREVITLPLQQLICVQSDDNYVDLYLADSQEPGRKMVFRCTLKSVEDQLADYPQFVRTHRSVLVNMQYVVNKIGTNHSIKSVNVEFNRFSMTVPLSKSYRQEVEELLIHPK